MPLLRNGHWADDNPWVHVEDDTPLNGVSGPVLCSLERFLNLTPECAHAVSGVWLKPDDDVSRLADHLSRIQLIAIDFPAYTDGRGYTQARLLRKQWEFSGELRAVGDVRPDQLLFMFRAGIDTFEFKQAPDNNLIKQILARYRVSYQPSYVLPVAG